MCNTKFALQKHFSDNKLSILILGFYIRSLCAESAFWEMAKRFSGEAQEVNRLGNAESRFLVRKIKLAKSEAIQVEARVVKALPNAQFLVVAQTGEDSHEVLAHIAGKMRKHFIRIVPGDMVTVELSPYDLTRGRIVYRQR